MSVTTAPQSPAVARVVRLLELLASAEGPLTGTEIASMLGLPPSSTHVLLQRLVDLRYVDRLTNERRYVVGPKLVKLAIGVLDRLQLRGIARPFLTELAKKTREDVYLAEASTDGIYYVDKVEGSQPVRVQVELGTLRPLHATSVGKLYLAMQPSVEAQRMIAELDLVSFTPTTIHRTEELVAELDQIRAQGYSISDQQHIDGIAAAAAPIFDARGTFVGALSLSIPRGRFEQHRAQLLSELVASGRAVSRRLGSQAAA